MWTQKNLARLCACAVIAVGAGILPQRSTTPTAPSSLSSPSKHPGLGKVFENSRSGDRSRFTVLEGAEDTWGEYLRVEELIRAGSPGFEKGKSGSPPLHVHNHQQECFEVRSGSFSYQIEGVEGHLGPGDKAACIPAGKRHNFWNADNATDLTVVYTLTPALTSERFFQTLCGLAQDAGTLDNVNPLQLFVTFTHYDLQLAIMPKPVWLVISKVWVPVLQLYWHPYYTKYTG